MSTTLSTVLFDAGGTLVDSDDLFERLRFEFGSDEIDSAVMLNTFDLVKQRSDEEFLDVKGLLKETCRVLAEEFGLEDLGDRAVSLYREVFLETVRLFPGVEETLALLQRHGIRMIIVSDADADVLIPEFDQLGISDYFERMIISSEVRAYKPADAMVEYILAVCGLPGEGVLFVGDNRVDVQTASKLGVGSVFIGRADTGATFTIESFSELVPLLEREYGLSVRGSP